MPSVRRVVLPLALGILCFPSCKTMNKTASSELRADVPTAVPLGLSMNDVSILLPYFPLKRDFSSIEETKFANDLKSLSPSLADKPDPQKWAPAEPSIAVDGDPFVPTAYFVQMHKIQAVDPRSGFVNDTDQLKDFRLMGIRLDPCANKMDIKGSAENCLSVLQLTWQKIDEVTSFTGFRDRNFHTVYRLTKNEVKEIITTLRAMHSKSPIDTKDMPLQPNPAILKEGVDGQYLKGAIGIVHRYARASRLFGFASLNTGVSGTPWSFTQGQFVNGSFLTIPVFATNPRVPSQEFAGRGQGATTLETGEHSTSEFSLPFIIFPGSSLGAENEESAKVFVRNAQAVNNPLIHSATNLDCGSCHRAFNSFNLESLLTEKPSDLHKFDYKSNRWNLSHVTDIGLGIWSTQMFSYSRSSPKISQRVINETADVLDSLVALNFVEKPVDWQENTLNKDLPVIKLSPDIARPVFTPTAQVSLKKGDTGMLVSKLSGTCLDLKDGDKTTNARFQIWDCGNANANQIFVVEAVIDGRFVFKSKGSGLCLQQKAAGEAIGQAACDSTSQQSFKIEPTMEGNSRFHFGDEELCLAITDNRASNGSIVGAASCRGHEWTFKPI